MLLRTTFSCLALLAATPAWAANGCAPGTFSITTSPDGRAASVLFDDFSVTGGGGSLGQTSTCTLHVPVELPRGTVGAYRVDYRGFAHLAARQSSRLVVRHAFGSDRILIEGPFDGDTAFTGVIGGGLSGTLDSRIILDLRSPADLAEALALLDSIDVAEIGTTTVASVHASIDRLAEERVAIATHLGGTADLLLGFGQPLDGPSGAAALAAFGGATLGANAHWNLDGGVSLLGGAAYVEQSAGGAEVGGSPLFAGGVRYVRPDDAVWRPFVEAGLWGSPDLGMTFTRHYANGAGLGDTSGMLVAVYGRAGVRFAPNPANEVVLAGTFGRHWLGVDGYAEPGGSGNLFPATVSGGTSTGDQFKATLAWTGQFTDRLEVTLSGGFGRAFGNSPVTADVDWVGRVTGKAGDLSFAEYGARVGWQLNAATTLDAFIVGTVGEEIGSTTQVGGAVRVKF